jgi:hypothetical protein
MPVIGFLNPASLDTGRDWIAAFYQGLAEAGPSNEVELLGGNGQLPRGTADVKGSCQHCVRINIAGALPAGRSRRAAHVPQIMWSRF